MVYYPTLSYASDALVLRLQIWLTQELIVLFKETHSQSERDKNVIVLCSKRVESDQNATERKSGMWLTNQVE